MYQLVYKNMLYINGKPHEIVSHLKELSKSYKTVKDLLDSCQEPLYNDYPSNGTDPGTKI